MNWKQLTSQTRSTINANFQFLFCELGKKAEVGPKPTFENPSFESKDELKNNMSQFDFHYWK